MKLLSKPELKEKKNSNALRLRETDRALSKEIKELNDFRASKEAKKQQILDEYIAFAEKIAGERALLEGRFASEEERKGQALRSLSALSAEADEKLARAKKIEGTFEARESNLQARETQLSTRLSTADEREKMLNKKADEVSDGARKNAKDAAAIDGKERALMNSIAERDQKLNERERRLEGREKDLTDAARHNESIAETLKNDRESFQKEKADAWAELKTERARDVREIVEESYKKREADLEKRAVDLQKSSDDLETAQSGILEQKRGIEAEKKRLESDRKAFETEKTVAREGYAAREAKLGRTEAVQAARAKELDAKERENEKSVENVAARERALASKAAGEADKALKRTRELDQVASTLRTRWESTDKDHEKRLKALNRRKDELDNREAVIKQKEIAADKRIAEIEVDSLEWNAWKHEQNDKISAREESVAVREKEAEAKMADAKKLKSAAETEAKELAERTGREGNRLAEERRALADSRNTLDRAWTELRTKQKKHGQSTT